MRKTTPLLAILIFCLIIALAPSSLSAPPSVTVDLQLPLGVRYEEVDVEGGSIIVGWLTIAEIGYEELRAVIRLDAGESVELAYSSLNYERNGSTYTLTHTLRETVPFTWSFFLRVPKRAGAFPVVITVRLERDGETVYLRRLRRVLVVGAKARHRASISVVAPCNPDGSYDPRSATGVFVVEEFSENPILYLLGLARKYTSLIGFFRVDVDLGPDARLLPVTIEVSLTSADGGQAQGVTLVHPGYEGEGIGEGARMTAYVKADSRGRVAIVSPIIALTRVESLEGDYYLEVRVRRLGSNAELGASRFPLKIVVIKRGDVGSLLLGTASAIALLLAIFLDAFRKLTTLEVAYAALSASLVFAITSIPGTIVWPVAQALLGPFDWVLTGVLYAFLMYAIYGALVRTVPRPGVFTLAVTTKWLLYLVVFGARNPFMSLIWLATTAFIMEPLLYLLGGTRGGSTLGTAFAFALGRFVDAYVDMNLYMIFYRLFYAQWYINLYCTGVSAYTFLGALLGCRLAEKLRGVSHE